MAHATVQAADWLKARCALVPLNSCLIRVHTAPRWPLMPCAKRKMTAVFAGCCNTVHRVLNGLQSRQIKRGKKSGERGHYGKCSLFSWNDFLQIAESIGTEMIGSVWGRQDGKDLGKWNNTEKDSEETEESGRKLCFLFLAKQQPVTKKTSPVRCCKRFKTNTKFSITCTDFIQVYLG